MLTIFRGFLMAFLIWLAHPLGSFNPQLVFLLACPNPTQAMLDIHKTLVEQAILTTQLRKGCKLVLSISILCSLYKPAPQTQETWQ